MKYEPQAKTKLSKVKKIKNKLRRPENISVMKPTRKQELLGKNVKCKRT